MELVPNLLSFLKRYNNLKKEEGFIPTVELLIEEIEEGTREVETIQLKTMKI